MTPTFILGREPHLSIAELSAVLGDTVRWEQAVLSHEALVAPCADAVDARTLMERLGGTVKIGDVWREVSHGAFDGNDEAIGAFVLDHTDPARKVRFGYSVEDLGGGAARVREIRAALTRGARAQKTWFTAHGRKVRHVTSRASQLSSVTVTRQELLPEDNGVEILVLVTTDHLLLARTLAVQPFAEWSARDYGRPARSMVRGMLPPKLARIMVNLVIPSMPPSRVSTAFTILDPFCGVGTMLTEALTLGVRVVGSDHDPEAIAAARENLAWRSQSHGGPTRSEPAKLGGVPWAPPAPRLLRCPVERLSDSLAPASIDAIVTEPYLGPVRGIAHRDTGMRRTIAELRELYVAAFREFRRVLKPGSRVIFVIPAFRTPHGEHVVDITNDVAALGFQRVNPFPMPLRDHALLRGKEDLPYARPDQRVGRRVLMFRWTNGLHP